MKNKLIAFLIIFTIASVGKNFSKSQILHIINNVDTESTISLGSEKSFSIPPFQASNNVGKIWKILPFEIPEQNLPKKLEIKTSTKNHTKGGTYRIYDNSSDSNGWVIRCALIKDGKEISSKDTVLKTKFEVGKPLLYFSLNITIVKSGKVLITDWSEVKEDLWGQKEYGSSV